MLMQADRFDGFGAQYQSRVSILAFCRFHGVQYVHRPFTSLDHVDASFPKVFEGFVNLGQGEILWEGEEAVFIDDAKEAIGNDDVLFSVSYCHKYIDKEPDKYYHDAFIEDLRHKYFATEKPVVPTDALVVHIRRGDVGQIKLRNLRQSIFDRLKRYISDRWYKKHILLLKESFPELPIHIYSESLNGPSSEVLELADQVFLDGDLREAFHAFVMAKVLLISKGAFSYSAALLSSAKHVFTPRFWHKPLKDWQILEGPYWM